MEFRPCIDIHDGKVKQIVGASLSDKGAKENFVSGQDAAFYADMYREKGIKGGHIVILNRAGTPEYESSKAQALKALNAYKGGLQIGGGITADNAGEFLDAGAAHVVVTSYVFRDGMVDYQRLAGLTETVGRDRLVLDLSCRKRDGKYYVVTDRWQKFTDTELNLETLKQFERYASEYLIHAADVEGKVSGVEDELLKILGEYRGIPVTYAGGVRNFEDLEKIYSIGAGRVNVTVGSALDLFGGNMNFDKVLEMCNFRT